MFVPYFSVSNESEILYIVCIFCEVLEKKLLTIFIVSSGSCIFKKETLYTEYLIWIRWILKSSKKIPCRKKYLEFFVPFRRELSDIIDDAFFSKTVIIWQFDCCCWEKKFSWDHFQILHYTTQNFTNFYCCYSLWQYPTKVPSIVRLLVDLLVSFSNIAVPCMHL